MPTAKWLIRAVIFARSANFAFFPYYIDQPPKMLRKNTFYASKCIFVFPKIFVRFALMHLTYLTRAPPSPNLLLPSLTTYLLIYLPTSPVLLQLFISCQIKLIYSKILSFINKFELFGKIIKDV